MSGGTIVGSFFDQAGAHPGEVALRFKRNGAWVPITWAEYERLVRRAAGGLRALGLDAGDKAAILSANRPEWHVADLAIQACGAATVPVYPNGSSEQVAHVTGHAGVTVVFCENDTQLAKVSHLLPRLRKAIVIDAEGSTDERVATWESHLAAGDIFGAAHPDDVDRHVGAVRPDDLCTICYTSGTTGPPKGAMLTHRNMVWTCDAVAQVRPAGPGDRRLSFLPLSHIAERTSSHFSQIRLGFETWFATSLETLREDLVDCRPTILLCVPRIWEKFASEMNALMEVLAAERGASLDEALKLGLERVDARQSGGALPADRERAYRELDAVCFAPARAAYGLDAARVLASGAAPISVDTLRFFHAIGVPIGEVYGQTEASGPTSINPPDRIKIGTVGPPVPGVEVRIAPDGEVLVRGGNVGPGYYEDPIATAELIDDEGWMHSGDVGRLDEDGYLRITDRKKDLIITAGGKNVAPQVIEGMLTSSPWIHQAVVVGDRRPYLTALITVDRESVRLPEDRRLVDDAVAAVNRRLARAEQIKKWHVFDREFAIEANEVTPTFKLRRRAIAERYADVIEDLYS